MVNASLSQPLSEQPPDAPRPEGDAPPRGSWITSMFSNPLARRLAGFDSVPGFMDALDHDIEAEAEQVSLASAAMALPSTSLDTSGEALPRPLRSMSSVSFGGPIGWNVSV